MDISRFRFHKSGFRRIPRQGSNRYQFGHQVNHQYLHCSNSERNSPKNSCQQTQQDSEQFSSIGSDSSDSRLSYVLENDSSFSDCVHQGAKTIIKQNDFRSLLRNISSYLSHCHSDIGHFQCWCIIDPITGDCYDIIMFLEQRDDPQFIFRRSPTEYHPSIFQVLQQLYIALLFDFITRHHKWFFIGFFQSYLFGDSHSGQC